MSRRVCVVYDCLYPHTVGGAQRWYRHVGARLAAEGHEVTYLTLRQWDRGVNASFEGVKVVAVGPRLGLYGRGGRRRILPPVVFGIGVFLHLLRSGRRYDVVHTCSFPYFSLLAAGAVRRLGGFRIVVDWYEVWTDRYWHSYLGSLAGRVGAAVQRACARVPQRAFCFSLLHARRLEGLGLNGPMEILTGEMEEFPEGEPRTEVGEDHVVVFAGRHIPEKRVPALVDAFVVARTMIPDLRLLILGDGPECGLVRERVAALGLGAVVQVPGFVDGATVGEALASAACMALPSEREGYGLVVIEAAARGTPSVVIEGADNAAVELIEEGVNGTIASSAAPADLADAMVRVVTGGAPLRISTVDWFSRNRERLSLASSLERVAAAYADEAGSAPR